MKVRTIAEVLSMAFIVAIFSPSSFAGGPVVVHNNTNSEIDVCVGYIYGGNEGDFGMSIPINNFAVTGWRRISQHSSIQLTEVGSDSTFFLYAQLINGTQIHFNQGHINAWINFQRFSTDRTFWKQNHFIDEQGSLRWGPNLEWSVPNGHTLESTVG